MKCKDCKHFITSDVGYNMHGSCDEILDFISIQGDFHCNIPEDFGCVRFEKKQQLQVQQFERVNILIGFN